MSPLAFFKKAMKILYTVLNFKFSCVYLDNEILICGGEWAHRNCYSYHLTKKEYKSIGEYTDADLNGHMVLKLKSDKDMTTLLSFGGKKEGHCLQMQYKSVWKDDTDCGPLLECTCMDIRAAVSGEKKSLLFLMYRSNVIEVFDMTIWTLITSKKLPILYGDCGVGCLVEIKTNELLLNERQGFNIPFDEKDKTFACKTMNICNSLMHISNYSFVCVNDSMLLFGGYSNRCFTRTDSIFVYTPKKNGWMCYFSSLPLPLSSSGIVFNLLDKSIHIIGGLDDNWQTSNLHYVVNAQDILLKNAQQIRIIMEFWIRDCGHSTLHWVKELGAIIEDFFVVK
ncbi:hypothetical protein RFI_14142 [Reticulomyxa filosa]|uniref:Uncharacterized protein n=1 Tax=Reticulomyxa filosa TaxID=46433 RepID=X6N9S5_RETFI|nr:hypothetical protein RFI_14142 [Reticulomyxa filosa]|eukprot:ETO23045.1 hypothetical protein RFI_14142 [Reticulomyxa filosa]